MDRNTWIKKCADKICEFYGIGYRRTAERYAAAYVDSQSVNDDPIGAAILIMEGISYANDRRA